jgi:hypothetical protein
MKELLELEPITFLAPQLVQPLLHNLLCCHALMEVIDHLIMMIRQLWITYINSRIIRIMILKNGAQMGAIFISLKQIMLNPLDKTL